jgi:hypothetical protein
MLNKQPLPFLTASTSADRFEVTGDPHDTPPYPSIAPYPPRLLLLCQLRIDENQ